ncbi:MAG: SMC-Scp complex subunit ScpB [Alphaproteobacteria bacterium]|nr:SMC-Scp complex subunit ScpB [Alphaproteobacteria bacterium]MCB1551273.1 SMC-Scp complex subunit ScpB [Alphaproteobacteria bacterium]MCB9984366.1 SMC-Scp complex subunit ScpB [Micavibrio sp.]
MSSEDINEDVNEVDEITEIEDDIINDENSGEEDLEQEELTALEDPAEQKRLIEALLFASPEPVTLRTIQGRLPDSADVGRILMELQEDYAQRGVNLVRLEDAWAFRTAPDIGPYLALAKKQEKKLSRAALETLAIIAYHQPVTRAEIENIRGVATNKGTLDVLLEAGWIKPGRRRETPGRPVTWMTSTNFLDEFGISELKDLPGLQELKASGLLDIRPAIETIPGGADLFAGQDGAVEGTTESENPAEDYEHVGDFDQISEAEESQPSDDEQEDDEQQKESA